MSESGGSVGSGGVPATLAAAVAAGRLDAKRAAAYAAQCAGFDEVVVDEAIRMSLPDAPTLPVTVLGELLAELLTDIDEERQDDEYPLTSSEPPASAVPSLPVPSLPAPWRPRASTVDSSHASRGNTAIREPSSMPPDIAGSVVVPASPPTVVAPPSTGSPARATVRGPGRGPPTGCDRSPLTTDPPDERSAPRHVRTRWPRRTAP